MGRIVLAFLLAPALGMVVAAFVVAVVTGHYPSGDGHRLLLLIGLSSLIGVYPVLLIVGFPALFVMIRRGWLSLTSCLCVAGLCAVATGFLLGLLPGEEPLVAASAALAAWLFWLIGIRNNAALLRE